MRVIVAGILYSVYGCIYQFTRIAAGILHFVDGCIYHLTSIAAGISHSAYGYIYQLACIAADISRSVDGYIYQLACIAADISHSVDGYIYQLACIAADISHSVDGCIYHLTSIAAGKFAWAAPSYYCMSFFPDPPLCLFDQRVQIRGQDKDGVRGCGAALRAVHANALAVFGCRDTVFVTASPGVRLV